MATHPNWWSLAVVLLLSLGCGASTNNYPCAYARCATGTRCDPANGACVPIVQDAGTGCTTDSQCRAPNLRCLVAEQRCVGCLNDGDCAAGRCDQTQRACVPQPDSCGTARALVVVNGQAHVDGDTSRATNDTQPSCALSTSAGADLVFSITLTERQRVVATVTSQVSGFRPVLALRAACSADDLQTELACGFPSAGASSAQVTADSVEAGTYFFWVDSEDGSDGPFTLDVTLETPSPTDTCSAARALTLETDTVQLVDDTRGLKDDLSSSCGGLGQPDAVYSLTLKEPKRLVVKVESLTFDFHPIVSVRAKGCPGEALGCSAEPSPVVDLPRVGPGTITVVVDGQAGLRNAGAYRLTVSPLEPVPAATNDACGQAQVLPLPANELGVVVAQSDTTGAADDARACGASGPDLVYELVLTEARQVSARVTPLAGSGLRPAVALRPFAACAAEVAASQLGCASALQPGGSANLSLPNLAPGHYALWVDGTQGTGGPFELRLELTPPPSPPPNDTCPGLEVPLGAAAVTLNGSTLGAADDVRTCASGTGPVSPDVVYGLTLGERRAVAVDLRAAGGSSLRPAAQLRPPGSCGVSVLGGDLGCAVSDPDFPDRVAGWVPALDPGTYPLWIEGAQGTQGPFTLRLVAAPPLAPPVNDACGSQTLPTLAAGVTQTGDTRAAANDDASDGCGLPPGSAGTSAPDLVWKLSLLSTQTVTITVTPEPGLEGQLFRPVVTVRGPGLPACGTASATKACQAAQGYGQPVSLTVPNLASGTYLVWVDGAGVSSGKFTIRVQ